MRLRNWKDTVPLTLDEDLQDVHPVDIDEPYFFFIWPGLTVWVKCSDGKWRKGVVLSEGDTLYEEVGVHSEWTVEYGSRKKKVETFAPLHGNIKPDTPEVHRLLRYVGVFV